MIHDSITYRLTLKTANLLERAYSLYHSTCRNETDQKVYDLGELKHELLDIQGLLQALESQPCI